MLPTGSIMLTTPNEYMTVEEADGTYAPAADGFVVTTSMGDVNVGGVTPAIPQGTFVHVTYGPTPIGFGTNGVFVRLDNLAMLNGNPNPTEDGTRVWYFATAGGGVPNEPSPFAISTQHACTSPDMSGGNTTKVQDLVLSDSGSSFTIPSGQEVSFTVTSGDNAGAYVAHNYAVEFIGTEGGDAWYIMDFTIARGP